jgi:hypothetical protein
MRDATKLTGATLVKDENEFQIGDVYLAPNGEFYIEVKRDGATCNTQVNSVKADLNSGKAKLKM